MSMAIYSRRLNEAAQLRELFSAILPQYGIVTDCTAYNDANALSADALRGGLSYGLIFCENEAELLLAGFIMRFNPGCRVALAVANDDLAVQSYLLNPCYCCLMPLSCEALETILGRFST
ncbi:MAG TPA: hypothetical protein PLN48_16425 [Lachnospiraceae bacterium]|nr:hypothetical protein [Lachnospiraceae bacterium]